MSAALGLPMQLACQCDTFLQRALCTRQCSSQSFVQCYV